MRVVGWVVVAVLVGAGWARVARAQEANAGAQVAKMMAADADPAFEVAAIKPSDPNSSSNGFHSDGRHISCDNETVEDMIWLAYGVHSKEIVNAPAWLGTARYDVDGVTDVEGEPNLKQMQGMYRKLLVERFALKAHRETRELPVYALRVGKGGAKLTKSLGDPNGQSDSTRVPGDARRVMRYTNMPMGEFAMSLQWFADRPVVNETGIAGRFDFLLKWTPEDSRGGDANAAPGLFTAIQEQLGLKLEAVKAPAEVFVVERVERPSGN